jgi:hypothetical protein
MKKISKTIAVLLVLIILVSGFTGCQSMERAGINKNVQGAIFVFGLLGLTFGFLYLTNTYPSAYVPVDTEEKIASLDQEENPPFTEVSASSSETEHSVLKKNLDSLRKAELASFMNVLQHFEADYSPADNSLYIGIRFRY